MTACICGEPTPCPVSCSTHDTVGHGYPCDECQAEWEAANPRTAAAISAIASGRGSLAKLNAARRADKVANTP